MTLSNNRRPSPGEARPGDAGSKGKLFIISAPSGAGKTTLCKAILHRFKDIRYSVSTTTRSPRVGEENGKDYFFVSEETFISGIKQNKWAEWARVHDHHYGTSADFIKSHLDKGEDVLLDIDVQGTRQILEQFPESITIFIMPPSIDALETRMSARGTDSPDVIAKRMKNAIDEIARKDIYRHVIVNDNLDAAILELTQLVQSLRKK